MQTNTDGPPAPFLLSTSFCRRCYAKEILKEPFNDTFLLERGTVGVWSFSENDIAGREGVVSSRGGGNK